MIIAILQWFNFLHLLYLYLDTVRCFARWQVGASHFISSNLTASIDLSALNFLLIISITDFKFICDLLLITESPITPFTAYCLLPLPTATVTSSKNTPVFLSLNLSVIYNSTNKQIIFNRNIMTYYVKVWHIIQ